MSMKPMFLLKFGLFALCIIFLQNITAFSTYSEDNAPQYSDHKKPLFQYSLQPQYRSSWPSFRELDEMDEASWDKRSRTHMPYRFG
uniref:Neuropeptide n=1 Tax=Echinococcus canadensis TaxID=519352 RepID=A0A915EX24_9CEST